LSLDRIALRDSSFQKQFPSNARHRALKGKIRPTIGKRARFTTGALSGASMHQYNAEEFTHLLHVTCAGIGAGEREGFEL
jgi:hypothetical protein